MPGEPPPAAHARRVEGRLRDITALIAVDGAPTKVVERICAALDDLDDLARALSDDHSATTVSMPRDDRRPASAPDRV